MKTVFNHREDAERVATRLECLRGTLFRVEQQNGKFVVIDTYAEEAKKMDEATAAKISGQETDVTVVAAPLVQAVFEASSETKSDKPKLAPKAKDGYYKKPAKVKVKAALITSAALAAYLKKLLKPSFDVGYSAAAKEYSIIVYTEPGKVIVITFSSAALLDAPNPWEYVKELVVSGVDPKYLSEPASVPTPQLEDVMAAHTTSGSFNFNLSAGGKDHTWQSQDYAFCTTKLLSVSKMFFLIDAGGQNRWLGKNTVEWYDATNNEISFVIKVSKLMKNKMYGLLNTATLATPAIT